MSNENILILIIYLQKQTNVKKMFSEPKEKNFMFISKSTILIFLPLLEQKLISLVLSLMNHDRESSCGPHSWFPVGPGLT